MAPFLTFQICKKRVEADLKHPNKIYTGGEKLMFNALLIMHSDTFSNE
jgi:hypothetical protein